MRTLALLAIGLFAVLGGPAFADDADTAHEKCMAYLTKTYGVPKSAYGNFSVHHLGGERYEVVGSANYLGEPHQALCKVNKGRVTSVVWS